MTTNERIYKNLPGNARLTVVVDAWKAKYLTGLAWRYVAVRFNRALETGASVQYFQVNTPELVHFEAGSVKMGQPILHPVWTLNTKLIGTCVAYGGRTTWMTLVTTSGLPKYDNYIVGYVPYGTLQPTWVSPVMHLGSLPERARGGGYTG
jgi:hypothetical protein